MSPHLVLQVDSTLAADNWGPNSQKNWCAGIKTNRRRWPHAGCFREESPAFPCGAASNQPVLPLPLCLRCVSLGAHLWQPAPLPLCVGCVSTVRVFAAARARRRRLISISVDNRGVHQQRRPLLTPLLSIPLLTPLSSPQHLCCQQRGLLCWRCCPPRKALFSRRMALSVEQESPAVPCGVAVSQRPFFAVWTSLLAVRRSSPSFTTRCPARTACGCR